MFGSVLTGCLHYEFSQCSVNSIFHLNITSISSYRCLRSQGRAVCHLEEQVRAKGENLRGAGHLFCSTNINTSAALVYQTSWGRMGFTKDRKVSTLIQAQLKKQSDASSVSQERKEQGVLHRKQKQGNAESMRRQLLVVFWSWGPRHSWAAGGRGGGVSHSILSTSSSKFHISPEKDEI